MWKKKVGIFLPLFICLGGFLLGFLWVLFKTEKDRKEACIRSIVTAWSGQTQGGHVKQDVIDPYEGDYYLSLTTTDNQHTHVHLITNKHASVKANHPPALKACRRLCYLVKKADQHASIHEIDLGRSGEDIVAEMLRNFADFQ